MNIFAIYGIVLYIVSVLLYKGTGKKYMAVLAVIIPVIMYVFVGMISTEFDPNWMAGPGADSVGRILGSVAFCAFLHLIYKAVKFIFLWLFKKIGILIKNILSK
jgi:hypothetical protein